MKTIYNNPTVYETETYKISSYESELPLYL